ncbi:MAG TPA: type VI secretion system tip protein TssI/VgrG [Fibrobacteria bacterium]|nr:type VI secretion system tip protein TssI/VgrG [Fibrobacteria bacterium]
MASADTSVFSLQVESFPLDTFRVIDFTGREALSECYAFTIRAVAFDLDLKFDEGIGVAATLIVGGAEADTKHYGIITSFTQVPDSDGTVMLNSNYEFILEPRVRIASYKVQSRIFQNKTVLEIVSDVLGDYFMKDTDFKIDAQYEAKGQDYSKREFTVQYNESDLDFVQRLLEEEGLFYFFNHEGDREVMIISNKKDAIKPLPLFPKLPFRPETGMHMEAGEYVDSMMKSMKFVTGRATMKDYNYRTPDTKVVGFFEMEGPGEYYHFGDHVKTTDEAKRLAQLRTEMFACEREIYRGTGVARDARPGYRFTLEHAGAEGFNGDYLITRVTHRGAFTDAGGNGAVDAITRAVPHYTNSFEAIPALVQFRPQLTTPKPKAPGILTAKVDGQKGSYAYLDEEGRYRMKLFFDRSEEKDGKASKAIRLAQPYAGAGYGMHFPLHTDTEIAVGFVDGDLDRPIGLGAIPNPGKGTPVKAGNKSQNMIKSHSGHSVTLDDKEGKTGIHIATSGGHALGLDDSADTKGFSVKTSGGNALAADDKNKNIDLKTTGGMELKLDDQGTTITLVTTGKNTLEMKDGGHVVTLKDGSGNISLTMNGDSGKVELKASQEIKLVVGASSLTMGMDGTIKLEGKDVTVKGTASFMADGGPKATMTAADTSVKGTGSVNIAGGTVTSQADTMNTIKGAAIMSDASAVNTVKGGAAVMLNP